MARPEREPDAYVSVTEWIVLYRPEKLDHTHSRMTTFNSELGARSFVTWLQSRPVPTYIELTEKRVIEETYLTSLEF